MKIMYNVTVSVDPLVESQWVLWMKETHIPGVMDTGHFINFSMQKILAGEDENGITYAIQYVAPDHDSFDEYQKNHAQRLQQEHQSKFEGKYAAFRTLMQVICYG